MPRLALANTSSWAAMAGAVHTTDGTAWCVPTLTSNGATSLFQYVPSDWQGTKVNPYKDTLSRQKVRVLCKNFFGTTQIATSPAWSVDNDGKGGDTNSVTCPSGYTPSMAQCAIDGAIDNGPSVTFPFVYQGSSCGNGITTINGASSILGQVLSGSSSLGFANYQALGSYVPPNPVPHGPDTGDSSPFIGGADIGGMSLPPGS
jgi:hypothetical protein